MIRRAELFEEVAIRGVAGTVKKKTYKDETVTTPLRPHPAGPKRGKNGRADIRDVAREAGVAISTVSRVTNGAPNVDPKLTRRIWKVIAELAYVPSRQAQAMGSGKTRLVGLIIPEINNPFFPDLIQGFEDIALESGYEMIVGSTYSEPDRATMWFKRMLQHGVQGVAMMTFGTEPEEIYHMAEHIPIVSVNTGVKRGEHATIDIDYFSGIRHAVQHLAALGHREIGFAGAESQNWTANLRREGFILALRELGLTVKDEHLFEHHHTFEGGIEAAKYLLQLKQRPTALVCSNDLIAIGAIGVFQHGGLVVPGDISIVGLDNITMARFTSPPLTTVMLSRVDLARTAFGALRWQFDRSAKRNACDDRVSTSLVIRESTTLATSSKRAAARRRS